MRDRCGQHRERCGPHYGRMTATWRWPMFPPGEGVVKAQLTGAACKGCPMSDATVKNGIERFLGREAPEVQ